VFFAVQIGALRRFSAVNFRVLPHKIRSAPLVNDSPTMNSCRIASSGRNGFARNPALQNIFLLLALTFFSITARAQTATISDAWWTFQQDCNGDGCVAGTLPGDHARLNWNPDVVNCTGSLTVYETVYVRPCGGSTWMTLYSTPLHTITGCKSSDSQYFDVTLSSGCTCNEYKIEIYRNGQSVPDDTRSPANDPDLSQHHEQLLSEDFCLSDYFSSCTSLAGSSGSHAEYNSGATKESGEPNHAGNIGGKSLWFCWTATNSTAVTFDTLGSGFDTLLAVYIGNSVSTLSLIVSNDDIAGSTNRQSSVTFTPTPGTTYHIAVDGFGGANGLVVLNWNQTGVALPDLVLWGPATSPNVITRSFDTNDCEVLEGCETPGTHQLLSFTTETRNIGAGDLVMGNPATNALFHYASCHGHYHFEEFANYDLLDTNGNVVASGHKVGFCLLDDHPWSSTANPQTKYSCGYQGIQVGWADVYEAGLPCQYIDVTGVAPGDYVLRMIVNPDELIPESDTDNNVTLVPVRIPPSGCVAPANDDFANARAISNGSPPITQFNFCATREPAEPLHAGNGGGHSVWFNWTPTSNQTAVITTKRSDFNTLLGVYTGNSVGALAPVISSDDITPGYWKQSEVTFAATAGVTYRIAVDGYNNEVGTVVLNLNPPANDDFANAQTISGKSGGVLGSTIGASKEPYETAHAFDVGGHSIWYRWTAPASEPVDFNTLGSDFNTTLAVYTATVVTNLSLVAANNDDTGGTFTSRVGFNAVAGTSYMIAVDGATGDSGHVVLDWNMGSRMGISPLVAGQMQINFSGVNNQRYAVLTSTNFNSWTTQTTLTMSGGEQLLIETNAAPACYFRTMLVP
jgi:hypothetical protein